MEKKIKMLDKTVENAMDYIIFSNFISKYPRNALIPELKEILLIITSKVKVGMVEHQEAIKKKAEFAIKRKLKEEKRKNELKI